MPDWNLTIRWYYVIFKTVAAEIQPAYFTALTNNAVVVAVIYSLRVFHTSFNNWLFSDVRVRTSLLKVTNNSNYPCCFYLCCSLNGHNYSFDLEFIQSLFHTSENRSKGSNYNWYYCHLYVPQFSALWQDPGICTTFRCLLFSLNGLSNTSSPILSVPCLSRCFYTEAVLKTYLLLILFKHETVSSSSYE